jgi:hypothetical protein
VREDDALDMMLASGLAVVFDIHPSDEFKIKLRTDDKHVEAFAEFWRALARHLSARDARPPVTPRIAASQS